MTNYRDSRRRRRSRKFGLRQNKEPVPALPIPLPIKYVDVFVTKLNSMMSEIHGWENERWAPIQFYSLEWVDLGGDSLNVMIQARIKPKEWPKCSGIILRFRRPRLQEFWWAFRGRVFAPHLQLEGNRLNLSLDVGFVYGIMFLQPSTGVPHPKEFKQTYF